MLSRKLSISSFHHEAETLSCWWAVLQDMFFSIIIIREQHSTYLPRFSAMNTPNKRRQAFKEDFKFKSPQILCPLGLPAWGRSSSAQTGSNSSGGPGWLPEWGQGNVPTHLSQLSKQVGLLAPPPVAFYFEGFEVENGMKKTNLSFGLI